MASCLMQALDGVDDRERDVIDRRELGGGGGWLLNG